MEDSDELEYKWQCKCFFSSTVHAAANLHMNLGLHSGSTKAAASADNVGGIELSTEVLQAPPRSLQLVGCNESRSHLSSLINSSIEELCCSWYPVFLLSFDMPSVLHSF